MSSRSSSNPPPRVFRFAPPPRPSRYPQIAWLCAVSPYVLLLVVITFGIHVRLGLGHWPTPMTEDYQTWSFRMHEHVLMGCLIFSIYGAGPLWILCLLIRPLRPSGRSTVFAQLAVCALGWLLIFGFLKFDPTTYSSWLLD